MFILREIEPDGLPIIVDVFKDSPSASEIILMRLYMLCVDEDGNKYVGEQFPLELTEYSPRSVKLLEETNETNNKKKDN